MKKSAYLIPAVSAILLLSSVTQAQLISISSTPLSSDGAEISSLGIIVSAWNAGGNEEGKTRTINGITFSDDQPASITYSLPGGGVHVNRIAAAGVYAGAMLEIMEDYLFGGQATNGNLTISDLAIGQVYQVQLTHHQADEGTAGYRRSEVHFGLDGGPGGSVFDASETGGYITTVKFVAEANSQSFLLRVGARDRFILNSVSVTTDLFRAHNPNPTHLETGVGTPSGDVVDVSLSWNTGLDPANPDQPNPAIKKHYIYLSKDQNLFPADPNLYYEAEVTASGATGVYNAVGLNYDGRYFWKIEQGMDDGEGGTYAAGDPNNIDSAVWRFDTIARTPTILSHPKNTGVDAGATAQFSIEADSLSPLSYQWYKYIDGVSDTQLLDGDKYTGATTDTLTIISVQGDDAGLYYCTLQNAAGTFLSDKAALAVNRLLAWYQFENTANDSAGENHGTEIGGLDYSSDVIVTTGGQTYAADPNGTSYVELSTDAYPKAGFGNGLNAGTISFWIKTDSTGSDAVLGNFNPTSPIDDRTAIHVLAPYTSSGQMRFYLRDFNSRFVELVTTETAIADNQWHHVAITYDTHDTQQVKAYFDGELVGSVSVTQDVSNFTPWQLPMTLLAQNARGIVNGRSTGQIDDLKIYNYVLSHLEIAQTTYDVSGRNPCVWPISSQYDYTGDCKVGIADFAIFAAQWLDCGLLICD